MSKKSSTRKSGKQNAGVPSETRAVVILGSGRSGTSLCAKILDHLGIAMETTLQRPNEMNPEGYFEDARLVEINRRLLEKLAPVAGVAPRTDFTVAEIRPEMQDLRAHLKERSAAASGTWGFKDPRVSMLLPIYRRAFQAVGIVPRYVFCARAADAVVESLQQAASNSRAFHEQLYFMRTFLALRDCAANCHVIHYERLLESPADQIGQLWAYVGEDGASCPLSRQECETLVDPKLNRSSLQARPVSNPLARRMGALLEGMEGNAFDRDAVLEELQDLDSVYSTYQVWIDRAAGAIRTMQSQAAQAGDPSGDDAQEESDTELAAARRQIAENNERIDRLQASLQAASSDAERRAGEMLTRMATLDDDAAARIVAEGRVEELTEEVATLRDQLRAAHAEADSRAEETDRRIAAMTEQHESACADLVRQCEDARAEADRQADCAKALGDEASWLQAEKTRLDEERDTAIMRARAKAGELEELRDKADQTEQELARFQRRDQRLRTEQNDLQKNLQKSEKTLAETTAERDAAVAEQERLSGSVRHRAGTLLVDATRKPGWNTLALPWRLARLRSGSGSDRGDR